LPEAACEGLRSSREKVVREGVHFLSGGAALLVEMDGRASGGSEVEEEEDRRGRVVDFRVASSPIRLINVRLLPPRFSFLVALASPDVAGWLVEEEDVDSAMTPSELPARLPRARPSLGGAGGAPKPRTGSELVRRSLEAKRFSVWSRNGQRSVSAYATGSKGSIETNREVVGHQDEVRVPVV
jgi:hypothetical protein